MKALGTGWAQGIGWKDIEVVMNEGGVCVRLHSEAKRLLGGRRIHVSVSCSKDMALALAIIEGDEPGRAKP